MANGRCRMHGGASLAGPASPNWKTGRHSKYLAPGLADRYRLAASDPNLISLRDEVALVDVRIFDLLEALGQTGNPRLWREARATFDAFKAAVGKGNEAVREARTTLEALDEVLAAGLAGAATWEELADRLDLRRRLVEAETKRMKDLHQMISAETALRLILLFIDEVKRNVDDPKLLTALSDQFRRVAGGGSSTPVAAALIGR
jgi:hypothetical protein